MSDALSDDDFDEVFTAEDLIGDGSPLLLAVSGGPDSTALMHAAAAWSATRHGPALQVATVDHGIRPESLREAEQVAQDAERLGLGHAILAWADRPKGPVSQEAARAARYGLLIAHAATIGATRIATAHTFDDQVETILMRLADGSGLSGLAGMAPLVRRGPVDHLRPFLHLRKEALVATCRARGWSFAEDPTNRDPRYARPRWRALSQTLAREGLTPDRIFRLGGRMRRAEIALEAVTDRIVAAVQGNTPGSLDFAALCREPDEIAIRVLVRELRIAAPDAAPHRLERVEAAYAALLAARLTRGTTRRTLAGCILSLDSAGRLSVTPEAPRRRGR